jgi:hypothetical protein
MFIDTSIKPCMDNTRVYTQFPGPICYGQTNPVNGDNSVGTSVVGLFNIRSPAATMIVLFLLLLGCTPLKYEQYAEVKALQGSPDRSTIDRYLLTQYKGMNTERIRVIYLQDGRYLKDEQLGNGYRNGAYANSIDIVAHCTLAHCNEILLAHNHPNLPYAEPSDMDIYTAARLSKFLLGTDIDLVASIIVSDKDTSWIFL